MQQQDTTPAIELDITPDVVEQLNDANNRVRQSLVGVPTHIGVTVLLDVVAGVLTNANLPEAARLEGGKYFASIAAAAAFSNGVQLEELLAVVTESFNSQAAQQSAAAEEAANGQNDGVVLQ